MTAPAVAGAAHAAPDTLYVTSPLPGGIAEVVRWIFNVPQWIQIGGFFLGLAVAAMLAVQIWRHRRRILAWLASRPAGVKAGMATTVGLVVLAGAWGGTASWNYMQHDNGFCTGCHVMEDPFKRFAAGAGKHDSLSCHACHQQSIFASAWQLYMWVAERPQEIKKHANVPTATCAKCHITGQPEVWQRIASTAGHRTHLESDSVALKDIRCVTCHGLEVHRFVPVDSTCGQSGCHITQDIVLGKMVNQPALHCASCHQFTLDVPALATRDSAAKTIVPTAQQCLGCHEMKSLFGGTFDVARDPHQGSCGSCHNPHEQKTPAEAAKTCTTSGCHANWVNIPFHVGRNHRKLGENCLTCHQPHQARIDPSDCTGCHETIRARATKPGDPRPPVPFDTTRALRSSGTAPASPATGPAPAPEPDARGKGDLALEDLRPAPPRDRPPSARRTPPGEAQDTFPHSPHQRLACITCHVSDPSHGRLAFEPPRGCQICHHQKPSEADCTVCHRAGDIAPPLAATVSVTVPEHSARPRSVAFTHETHREPTCITCHTAPVTLEPLPPVKSCSSCHEDHHTARRDCVTCHTAPMLAGAHADTAAVHQACDACHTPATVARLVPTRSFCLTCHEPEREHYRERECTTCHFLAPPEAYRSRVLGKPVAREGSAP